MNWYTWTSIAAFDAWHATVIAGLNMPWIGVDQANHQPQPDKQQTTAYTAVTEVSNVDWRAPVAADIANTYTDGFGQPCEPPPSPEP